MTKKRSRKKKIILSIIGFKLAIIIGVIAFLFLFNFNYFKPRIEAELTKALEQKVKIKGDIKFGLAGWRPAIAIYQDKIGKKIEAKKFEISPSLIRPDDGSLWHFFIEIDDLKIGGVLLGDYKAPVYLFSTGFEIPELHGHLGKARLSGKVKFVDDKLKLDADLTSFPYAKIVEGMEGDADLNLKLSGKGEDLDAIIKTLDGEVLLTGGNGQIKNSALKIWTTDLLMNMFSGKKDLIKLNCIIANFAIKDGIGASKVMFLDAEELALEAKGGFNLIDKTIDFKLTPRLKQTSLVNVALPVNVTGSFDSPQVSPAPEAVVKKLGTMFLSTINPAAALLPLLLDKKAKKNPCALFIK